MGGEGIARRTEDGIAARSVEFDDGIVGFVDEKNVVPQSARECVQTSAAIQRSLPAPALMTLFSALPMRSWPESEMPVRFSMSPCTLGPVRSKPESAVRTSSLPDPPVSSASSEPVIK